SPRCWPHGRQFTGSRNAERRMQNVERRNRPFSILHSAFCVLHSWSLLGPPTNPSSETDILRTSFLMLRTSLATRPQPHFTGSRNAERRMQNVERRNRPFSILHSAF